MGQVIMRLQKTKVEYRQDLVAAYRMAKQPWPASSKDMAAWAIRNGLWEMSRRSAIDICAKELAEAMREEYFTDAAGRRVRKKHCLRRSEELPDGTHRQTTLWLDLEDDADRRDDIEEAFQQRRSQIFTDCRHLKTDVDSYNEFGNPGKPIQMLFDFTADLEESEQSAEYDGITG